MTTILLMETANTAPDEIVIHVLFAFQGTFMPDRLSLQLSTQDVPPPCTNVVQCWMTKMKPNRAFIFGPIQLTLQQQRCTHHSTPAFRQPSGATLHVTSNQILYRKVKPHHRSLQHSWRGSEARRTVGVWGHPSPLPPLARHGNLLLASRHTHPHCR